MIRVMLSGPYSSDPMGNTIVAARIQHRLMDMGFSVFCPHTAYHWLDQITNRPYRDWMEACKEELRRSDVVLRFHRLDLPELDDSPGSREERSLADDLGKPWFESEEDLYVWAVEEKKRRAV